MLEVDQSPLSVDTEKYLIEIKKLMEKMSKIKIAFQGDSAYSHIAINEVLKSRDKTCSTFEETFKTAFEDDSYKIIPIRKFFSRKSSRYPLSSTKI